MWNLRATCFCSVINWGLDEEMTQSSEVEMGSLDDVLCMTQDLPVTVSVEAKSDNVENSKKTFVE